MRLAHFTDLHLRSAIPGTSPVAGRRSREVLAAFTAALEEVVRRRVDAIAITGDLLDVPHFLAEGMVRGFAMSDTERWVDAVRCDYRMLRALLESTGLPYVVLPGNHDLPAAFFEVFPARPDLCIGGFRLIGFADYEHEAHIPRRFMPSRGWFDQALEEEESAPQIHLQHYPLFPVGGGYPYHYLEHEFLRRRIETSGRVALCLSGHFHPGTEMKQSGGVAYAVTPGFCTGSHPWRVYHLETESISYEEASATPSLPSPVVFLDRDGVINDLPSYREGPEAMRLIPGSAEAIRRLNQAGLKAVVVTSQSCIGLGYVSEEVVKMVHERMHDLLAREGAYVDAVYFTRGAGAASILPGGEADDTRKSLLIEKAISALALDRQRAWLVGDRLSDMEAAREAALTGSVLVRTGFGARAASERKGGDAFPVVENLSEAVENILSGLDASALMPAMSRAPIKLVPPL